jgi:prepilin-type N-terminal cleavage/methylation domain-containing protein
MTHHPRLPRRAFTLIELLVAMGVIVLLASISVMVIGNVNDNDRTVDGASLVRQYLMIAKSRAARDQAPRGVRFVVSVDPDNVAKNTNTQWVTELQYIEKASVYIPQPVNPTIGPTDPNAPKVSFYYNTSGTFQLGSVDVRIQNLNASDAALIVPNCLISLFNLGFSARVQAPPSPVIVPNPDPTWNPSGVPGSFDVVVSLDATPDGPIGAGGVAPGTPRIATYTSFQFGITTPARPLLGEPAVQLPRNICVDLMSSSLNGTSTATGLFTGTDFDIVFLPDGQLDPNCSAGATNQLFLWIRDYTKNGGNPAAYPGAVYSQGGEQQIASLKAKTGSLGTFPVAWTATPFEFAVLGATTP